MFFREPSIDTVARSGMWSVTYDVPIEDSARAVVCSIKEAAMINTGARKVKRERRFGSERCRGRSGGLNRHIPSRVDPVTVVEAAYIFKYFKVAITLE